jgi:hypothetical protein
LTIIIYLSAYYGISRFLIEDVHRLVRNGEIIAFIHSGRFSGIYLEYSLVAAYINVYVGVITEKLGKLDLGIDMISFAALPRAFCVYSHKNVCMRDNKLLKIFIDIFL